SPDSPLVPTRRSSDLTESTAWLDSTLEREDAGEGEALFLQRFHFVSPDDRERNADRAQDRRRDAEAQRRRIFAVSAAGIARGQRSEEHTSELQSPYDL